MRLSQILTLSTLIFYGLISCKDTMGEQRNSVPKENTVPSARQNNTERPASKKYIAPPAETPQHKNHKKKKSRALDTLRPVVAAP